MQRTISLKLLRAPLLRRVVASGSRPISYGTAHMAGTLEPTEPPLPSTNPTESFQLLTTPEKAGESEDVIFAEQVKQVEEWWSSSRYKGIKRPYSAEDVVSKRGTLQQVYPSSLMARKLFNLLENKASRGEPVHTSAYSSLLRCDCRYCRELMKAWSDSGRH